MCDANSKYSRNNKTATSSTLPPMTLTVHKMTGDNKAYAIVASLPSNCGQSLTTTFRGNREYKEDKEDGWLKQNDEKKISSSTDSDNKNNSNEDIPTLNQKCNYLLDYTNKNTTTSNDIHCSKSSIQGLRPRLRLSTKSNSSFPQQHQQHILKVTPQFINANENNTNKLCTHNTDTKYSSTADRQKDHNKRQEKAKYDLPDFLRENEKTNIQDYTSILNSVASTSEDVDLPHKRYSRK